MNNDFFEQLEELLDEVDNPPLKEGEFTTHAIKTRRGWKHEKAKRVIEKWIEDGLVECVGWRLDVESGRRAKGYRFIRAAGKKKSGSAS